MKVENSNSVNLIYELKKKEKVDVKNIKSNDVEIETKKEKKEIESNFDYKKDINDFNKESILTLDGSFKESQKNVTQENTKKLLS